MFEGKSFLDIIQIGGATMYVLLCCSLVSISIFLERIYYYRKQSRGSCADFIDRLGAAISRNEIGKAEEIAVATAMPCSRVIQSALKLHGRPEKSMAGAMERAIIAETRELARFTSIVGTIGNIGVYIGLFGTVLGIVRAFHDISATGVGGISTVIEGVGEALVCTAAGLFVAIPAVVFFNYFTHRVERFEDDMRLCASEFLEMLKGNQ